MNQHVKLAIKAIYCYRGDNVERARRAFKGQTAEQMQEHYGQSGETKASILAGYEVHERKCKEAIEWLENLSNNNKKQGDK